MPNINILLLCSYNFILFFNTHPNDIPEKRDCYDDEKKEREIFNLL